MFDLETTSTQSILVTIAVIAAITYYMCSLLGVYQRNQQSPNKTKPCGQSSNENKFELSSKSDVGVENEVKEESAKCEVFNAENAYDINMNKENKENTESKNIHEEEIKEDEEIKEGEESEEGKEDTQDTQDREDKEAKESKIENAASKITKEEHFNQNGGKFNPRKIISSAMDKEKKPNPLRKIEHLGCISLDELNKYNYNHETRQLISIFGTIFDVTDAVDKYGKDGTYKEFAGHDITLILGSGKMNEKWLDRFVQMEQKQKDAAKGWIDFYRTRYPIAGTLDKWSEDTTNWQTLTEQELKELNAECTLM